MDAATSSRNALLFYLEFRVCVYLISIVAVACTCMAHRELFGTTQHETETVYNASPCAFAHTFRPIEMMAMRTEKLSGQTTFLKVFFFLFEYTRTTRTTTLKYFQIDRLFVSFENAPHSSSIQLRLECESKEKKLQTAIVFVWSHIISCPRSRWSMRDLLVHRKTLWCEVKKKI